MELRIIEKQIAGTNKKELTIAKEDWKKFEEACITEYEESRRRKIGPLAKASEKVFKDFKITEMDYHNIRPTHFEGEIKENAKLEEIIDGMLAHIVIEDKGVFGLGHWIRTPDVGDKLIDEKSGTATFRIQNFLGNMSGGNNAKALYGLRINGKDFEGKLLEHHVGYNRYTYGYKLIALENGILKYYRDYLETSDGGHIEIYYPADIEVDLKNFEIIKETIHRPKEEK